MYFLPITLPIGLFLHQQTSVTVKQTLMPCVISDRHLCTRPLYTHRIWSIPSKHKTSVSGYAFTSLGKRDSGDKKRLIMQVLRLIALKQSASTSG